MDSSEQGKRTRGRPKGSGSGPRPTPVVGEITTAEERQLRVLQLRLQGMGYDEIARVVGFADGQDVAKALTKAVARAGADEAGDMRAVMNMQLDMLLATWLPRAQGRVSEDTGEIMPPSGAAADRVLKILSQKAQLNGLIITQIAPVNPRGEEWKPYVPSPNEAGEILAVLAGIGALQPEPDTEPNAPA